MYLKFNPGESISLQDVDRKITQILMDNGADPMIPNIANKETAFHYCGLSGNSEVILVKSISSDLITILLPRW